ncbi:MAG TPA: hypothetical protein VJN43_01980 [Bryobacteraceae bacterium]|nr:hypothetical protein [Bryobacteraceae bacterium]
MNASLIPFVAGWVALACGVAGLAIYRRMISGQEDEMIHVRDSESVHISHQATMAQRLEIIDRWGKILTVVALVYGVALAAAYFYQVWMAGFNQV